MTDTLFNVPRDAIETTSDDCYTPRWVFDAMGLTFDLDVAAPPGGALIVPAADYLTVAEDGLVRPWRGIVWCNPPFSKVRPWAEKWASHPTGALLVTYTPGTASVPLVLEAADAVSFVTINFHRPDGRSIRPQAGTFVAFRGVGVEPAQRLAAADRFGAVLYGRPS